ncbi:HAD hydrolase-like protein [Massilia sp. Leaf139]|uniref:HAD hydrolase-like protein n=1 Tax=Massilia sp. Leaf139 TaxID=1736272 RepID=UPI0007015EA8|nr:HAD hydrolase-like protein [Massilia sp. Leaf139]KQQ88608.1 haloacid dehalogenase [Massilia sp. Leaf139]
MRYRLAIFDFDGTLADSFPFLLSVFNRIADEHGFRRIDPAHVERLRYFGTREMMRHVGMPAWKLPLAAASFKTLMRENAGQVRLFPQVDHALRELARDRVDLTIVSSNAEDNVRQVLGPELSSLISQYECGMSIFGKTARIRKVLKRAAVTPDAALYIGDQALDAEAARRAGVAFAAVHWGYAPIEVLRKVEPEHEFDVPAALAAIATLRAKRAAQP